MSLRKQAILGVKWNFLQQFSVQVINFGVQVILARLLMPEMFGLIAMIIVFISIGQTLMDGGMTSSLIRTDNPDQADYSTVFITNLVVSILIYFVIYIISPYIASFYNQEILSELLRVLSISFIINAFVAVHVAKLTKEMNFKLQMKFQIPATALAGIIGVFLAYQGHGVWSLVWLNLSNSIIFALLIWYGVDWHPSYVFNKDKLKEHFSFGYKLTLSGLINTIYNDAYRIIIGKMFSPSAVGYFNHAESMRLFPVQQISAVLGKVTYPLFSKIKNDIDLKDAYRSIMKLILLVTIPIMLSLILIAEEGFRFLFGEKWLPSVLYFQILSLASIVRPVSVYNLNILKVKGRSDLFLKLEIFKKLVGIVMLVIGVNFGIIGLVISLNIFSFFSYFINMYFSGALISYSTLEQLKDSYYLYLIGALSFYISYSLKLNFQYFLPYDLAIIFIFSITNILLYFIITLTLDKSLLSMLKKYNK